MRNSLLFAALLGLCAPAIADDHQTEDDRAAAAVTAFMESFNAKDEAAMTALAMDGAMVTVIEEKDGEDRLQTLPLDRLISSIAGAPVPMEEPIWNIRVMQEGPVATVVASFDFLIDGQRSHCGTNVFNLVRAEGEWRIAGIAYSHIEQGCTGAPEQ